MEVLRTPDDRFADLPDFPFSPNYHDIDDAVLGTLRLHYLDEGPKGGKVILCLHGEPSWCFLYRKMIPIFVAAGYRVIAPDLIGFGRSDKPTQLEHFSYQRHIDWLVSLIETLELAGITLIAQDWGGLLGLRIATEHSQRFAQISLANTGLPTGDQPMQAAFLAWRKYALSVAKFDAGAICGGYLTKDPTQYLSEQIIQAYRAPFPDQRFTAAARAFPSLVPITVDDPATQANRKAWQALMVWNKPMLMCFSDNDPITAGGDKAFINRVPGCRHQPHTTLKGSHFVQEYDGENWAKTVLAWLDNCAS